MCSELTAQHGVFAGTSNMEVKDAASIIVINTQYFSILLNKTHFAAYLSVSH